MKSVINLYAISVEPQYEYELSEVIENPKVFIGTRLTSEFLGLDQRILPQYVKLKTKIIRSKTDGKLYVIKRKLLK